MTLTLQDGRYALGDPIGRGPRGTVLAARDVLLERDVAIKVLHPAIAADPAARRRFELGTRRASRLAHPAIVAVLDSGQLEDGRPYAVSELVPGSDLGALGPLDGPRAAAMARRLAPALRAAHARGVVHGAVTARNVLVHADGRALLCDFALARPAGASPEADLSALRAVLGLDVREEPTRVLEPVTTALPRAAAAAPAPVSRRRRRGRTPTVLAVAALAAGSAAVAAGLLVPASHSADERQRPLATTTVERADAPAATTTEAPATAVPAVPQDPAAPPAPPTPPNGRPAPPAPLTPAG